MGGGRAPTSVPHPLRPVLHVPNRAPRTTDVCTGAIAVGSGNPGTQGERSALNPLQDPTRCYGTRPPWPAALDTCLYHMVPHPQNG